jgi:polysaccharide pyruvyl transferase WcaK-like protein
MDPKTVFFGISNSLNLFPLQKIWTTRKKKIIHIGLHRPTNAGDTLLFSSVRKLIGSVLNDRWQLEPLRTTVTSAKIEDWNEIGKAVVVGGGGLFLKDTNPNDVSGWQWPCGVRDLAKLRTPLILFAVGYNRFRGQEEFSNVFRENIVELVCRAKFVGLRNQGSIANLKSYLPEHLWQKLVFQPCPTTILKYMDKRIELNRSLKRCRIGLNLAFDRHNLRFRGREFEILDDIAKAMKWAQQNNWKIDLISHMPLDATVAPWLIRHGVVYEEVNLFGVSADKVIEYYRDLPITIGMRGHSQMVPFGVGNAIISLVSHDKLAWFLEDIQHPEWGIEINKPGLEGSLKEKIQYVGGNLLRIRKEIELSQALLWSVTHNNLQTVKGLVEGTEELS